MKIEFVEIQNFRKLKACRIDFAEKETVFVGANNSGKTSATDALRLFLKEKKFSTRDFTLSNWKGINEVAKLWIAETDTGKVDLSIGRIQEFLPSLDVWIKVESSEIHYVHQIIPTLGWKNGLLGIRLRLEPKNMEVLYKDFYVAYSSSKRATGEAGVTHKKKFSLNLWPATMWDFLEEKLNTHFEVQAYILDPSKITQPEKGVAVPQTVSPEALPLDRAPFNGLIKVDIINAQRGFSDPNADPKDASMTSGSLSAQFKEYYRKHLNPFDQPAPTDIEALQSIDDARTSFDVKLKESFSASLSELELLNYPGSGFGNPSITISSKVSAIDGLDHDSAVQFDLLKKDKSSSDYPRSLPEKYNGLGYQNLISMVFKLIRFRDEWMQVGKRLKSSGSGEESMDFEPLHLVLIEEPEAHLHAQIQQVFIRKAYDVLRNNERLGTKTQFTTQLVVSTHSNHIAHEIDFTSLRYFKRKSAVTGNVPTSTVVNLSSTFGNPDQTTKFAIRYLRTTHCDLFFADAAILIEGPAERMLVPHFIKHHYPDLASCYISLLEIGGSHAHTLRPLIEDLGIITLILTDIDSVDPQKNRSAVQPERSKKYETGNTTLSSWLPKIDKLDDLLKVAKNKKHATDFPVRVAYQFPITVSYKDSAGKDKSEEALPYTFEDALVFANLDLFKTLKGNGLIKKFSAAANCATVNEASKLMFEALRENPKKAEFALELLFLEEPEKLKTPIYIEEGLQWLHDQLKTKPEDFTQNASEK